MEQPIVNESTEESSVSDRLEGVEDDLLLLKSEVKQTLIDLREFMMKGSAMSVTSAFVGPAASSSNGQVSAAKHQESPSAQAPPVEAGSFVNGTPEVQDAPPPPVPAAAHHDAGKTEESGPEPEPTPMTSPTPFPQPIPAPALQNVRNYPRDEDSMDSVRMHHIIGWLGTAAERGFEPKKLKRFLQAYELSGYLTPTLAMFIYRSMEEFESENAQYYLSSSPTVVSQCLQELHEIIINPGYAPAPKPPVDSGHDG